MRVVANWCARGPLRTFSESGLIQLVLLSVQTSLVNTLIKCTYSTRRASSSGGVPRRLFLAAAAARGPARGIFPSDG